MAEKDEVTEEIMMDASDLSVALRTNLQIISRPYASDEWLVRNVSFRQEVRAIRLLNYLMRFRLN